MKKISFPGKMLRFSWMLLFTGLFSSCLKSSDSPIQPSKSIPFTGISIVPSLAAQPSLKLFNKAFNRLGLPAIMDSVKGYTIFALTDSAMTAQGLTETIIGSLPVDSLRKLITYQIVEGLLDEPSLMKSVGTLSLTTLKQDTVQNPTGSFGLNKAILFVKETEDFHFNGLPVAKGGAPVQCSNGYIYPVTQLAANLPTLTTYDVISSDPDLSMFNRALIIGDSLRNIDILSVFGLEDTLAMDVGILSRPANGPYTQGCPWTVLAPTNKAFNDAGFYTDDDIVQYALSTYTGVDLDTYFSWHYSRLDSVLKHHILFNYNTAAASPLLNITRIFYYDMLDPSINNGILNNFDGYGVGSDLNTYYGLKLQIPLTFSAMNGDVYVQWSPDPSVPKALLPRDVSPLHPQNNFITSNGALYKIDKLFYPVVN